MDDDYIEYLNSLFIRVAELENEILDAVKRWERQKEVICYNRARDKLRH